MILILKCPESMRNVEPGTEIQILSSDPLLPKREFQGRVYKFRMKAKKSFERYSPEMITILIILFYQEC